MSPWFSEPSTSGAVFVCGTKPLAQTEDPLLLFVELWTGTNVGAETVRNRGFRLCFGAADPVATTTTARTRTAAAQIPRRRRLLITLLSLGTLGRA
jgi:hypothetical protein